MSPRRLGYTVLARTTMCVCTSEPIVLFTGRQQNFISLRGNLLLELDIARHTSRGKGKRGEKLTEADCQVPTLRLMSLYLDWSDRIVLDLVSKTQPFNVRNSRSHNVLKIENSYSSKFFIILISVLHQCTRVPV